MRVVNVRNVAEALALLPSTLEGAVRKPSRAGEVLELPFPVATVYSHPTERVLLDPIRDANPFLHLLESLFMLAGRRDTAFLDRYVSDFGKRFAEEDGNMHDAYGYRWRKGFEFDQLQRIIDRLQKDPNDRQCVLQMWDSRIDGFDDLRLEPLKTRPCNTHAYFRITEQFMFRPNGLEIETKTEKQLDMTVCCRSNDAWWGAYGANAVHFSVLQEYLAARIGVAVGTYTQMSNNFHVYTEVYKEPTSLFNHKEKWYPGTLQMVTVPDKFDEDLVAFMDWHDSNELVVGFSNKWFQQVAQRMVMAHRYFKMGQLVPAIDLCNGITAADWRVACQEWLQRRIDKKAAKSDTRSK